VLTFSILKTHACGECDVCLAQLGLERCAAVRPNTDALLLTAVDKGVYVGVSRLALPDRDRVAHIDLLYVASTHRRRGLGRTLLLRAENTAAAHGASRIMLADSDAAVTRLGSFSGYHEATTADSSESSDPETGVMVKILSAAAGEM
jgi:GNAT superfamily N-acetyltransferase